MKAASESRRTPLATAATWQARHGRQLFFSIAAISAAVVMNIVLHIDIKFAIGMGLSILSLYAWRLKHRGHNVMLVAQLQKVE